MRHQGKGRQYDFTPSLGLRLEAERYRVNDAVGNKGDVDLVSLGLVYRFGAPTPAPAPRAAVPAYVAPAPASVAVMPPPPALAPRPGIVAPPPAPAKVTFSADSLFDFARADVTPAGAKHLKTFAADVKGVDYEVITVIGHTDRIGPHASNMKLSERRAESVKTYLVQSAAIPAAKIAVKGAGETDPVTKPGECAGEEVTRKLIACLQPDRRVQVEVSGTK